MTECIMPICHGTSADFRGLAGHAATEFKTCHLVLAVTLDAHNMAYAPEVWDESLATARALGDRWLRKNLDYFYRTFAHVTLARWDDVKADPRFPRYLERARAAYSGPARAWIDSACAAWADMAFARGAASDRDALFRRSVAYMIEEIAGSAVYHAWYGCPAVYDGLYFDGASFPGLAVPPHHVLTRAAA